MRRLNKEDQEKWNEWDWTSSTASSAEIASFLCEQFHAEARKLALGPSLPATNGCCVIS